MTGSLRNRGFALLVGGFLCACSGGGGSDNSTPPPAAPPPPPAPSALSYGAARTFVVGSAIAPISPTVTGAVTSYDVTPALPAGLAISATNGQISGTPTAPAAAANYTLSANNATGSTSAVLSITVNDLAPVVSYPQTALTLTTGVPVTLTPVSAGGTVTSWTVSPVLPAGLGIDPHTGVIQGAPTAVGPTATYRVSAQNSGGQASADVSFAVQSGVLLELGHAEIVDVLRATGDRVLSRDTSGHWVLWSYTDAAQLADGEALCTVSCPINQIDPWERALKVDLAGNTVVAETDTALEIRSADDGHVLASITGSFAWWQLARDGSYVAAGTATELRVWSRAGAEIVNRAGDYRLANVFAAPGDVRIARGALGETVIQNINVSTGGSTTSPAFLGTFTTWFSDGERFLTTTGTTVRTYTRLAVQLDITALTTVERLAGYGDYFWTVGALANGPLSIYRVGASTSPVAVYLLSSSNVTVVHSGPEIGLLSYGAGSLSRIDLRGATPVRTDSTVPSYYLSSFAIDETGHWLTGASFGVVMDQTTPGSARPFGYGAARSIAGSSQRVAIATASGRVVYYDAATRALEGTISFPSSEVSISADGSVLAAAADAEYAQDRSIKIFALPAASEIHTWPYAYGAGPYPTHMALSSSGTVLAQEITDYSTGTGIVSRQTSPATGGSAVFADACTVPLGSECPHIILSPSGRYVAVANVAVPNPGNWQTVATNLYDNGALFTAVPGAVMGWQTDDLVLANVFELPSRIRVEIAETRLYDVDGQVRRSVVLPFPLSTLSPGPVQAVGSGSLYVVNQNSIYSTVSGEVLWSSANPMRKLGARGVGAVAGGFVVFASGSDIRIEPR